MDLPPDVMRGKNAMVHEVIDGHTMRVSINSFFQSRTDGAATLARLVREATGPDKVIADLYCGVGLFAVTADRPKRIVAVERGRSAVADAKHNLKGYDARVTRADVGKWHGNKVDVVIADPSRAGLGKDGARTVLACDAERVVLVSCDAAALARDIGLLVERRLQAHVGDARRPVRAHAAHRVRDGARPLTPETRATRAAVRAS